MRMHGGNIDTLPASITEVQTLRDLQQAFPVEGASATVVVRSDADDAEPPARRCARLEARRRSPRVTSSPATTRSGRRTTGRPQPCAWPCPTRSPTSASTTPCASCATTWPPRALVPRRVRRRRRRSGEPRQLRHAVRAVADRGRVRAPADAADHGGDLPQHPDRDRLDRCSTSGRSGSRSGCWRWCSSTAGARGCSTSTNPGFVIDWIPVFVLVVLVGLSMDYHVFVVSRIREHVLAGMTTRRGGRARRAATRRA